MYVTLEAVFQDETRLLKSNTLFDQFLRNWVKMLGMD